MPCLGCSGTRHLHAPQHRRSTEIVIERLSQLVPTRRWTCELLPIPDPLSIKPSRQALV